MMASDYKLTRLDCGAGVVLSVEKVRLYHSSAKDYNHFTLEFAILDWRITVLYVAIKTFQSNFVIDYS